MNINIDLQAVCCKKKDMRGIQYYIVELVHSLLKRQAYSYTCSFADYKSLRGNVALIQENLGGDFEAFDKICQCDTMSFRTTLDVIESGKKELYNEKIYEELYDCESDLFFFSACFAIVTKCL